MNMNEFDPLVDQDTFYDELQTIDMQQLCDQIRSEMTEDEMVQALESSGFAVHETGQELVEAVAEAVVQGDIEL